jgi:hypothetical protein
LFDGLTFKVADREERTRAIELQRLVYSGDVGHIPQDEFDENGHYLVVTDANRNIIGAFRIVGPEHRPFDLERFVDLSQLIGAERLVGLIGRLCIRHADRNVTRRALLPAGMMRLAFVFSAKHGFTDLVMYTFDHLLNFYRAAFFQPLNLDFYHPGYGCRMHVMHLDLVDLESRLARSRHPMGRFLFGSSSLNIVM